MTSLELSDSRYYAGVLTALKSLPEKVHPGLGFDRKAYLFLSHGDLKAHLRVGFDIGVVRHFHVLAPCQDRSEPAALAIQYLQRLYGWSLQADRNDAEWERCYTGHLTLPCSEEATEARLKVMIALGQCIDPPPECERLFVKSEVQAEIAKATGQPPPPPLVLTRLALGPECFYSKRSKSLRESWITEYTDATWSLEIVTKSGKTISTQPAQAQVFLESALSKGLKWNALNKQLWDCARAAFRRFRIDLSDPGAGYTFERHLMRATALGRPPVVPILNGRQAWQPAFPSSPWRPDNPGQAEAPVVLEPKASSPVDTIVQLVLSNRAADVPGAMIQALSDELDEDGFAGHFANGLLLPSDAPPELTPDNVFTIEDDLSAERLDKLEKGARPTKAERTLFRERWIEQAFELNDADLLLSYSIAELLHSDARRRCYALWLTGGYSCTEVTSRFGGFFKCVDDAYSALREEGYLDLDQGS